MTKRTGSKRAYSRREFMQLAGAGLALGGLGFPALASAPSRTARVIVLGIDGMDPGLVQRFMAEGRMPHAQHLVETGCFSHLRTSDPPQSPVAWSNFISGTNPGGHGIYDFIARDPSTLMPYFSCSRIVGTPRTVAIGDTLIPLSGRKVVNLRKGPTFWNELESRGIDCVVFRMPANFPPTKSRARTLSGLGTPDIHGGYGIFTFYTDKKGETTRNVAGGRMERVQVRDGLVRCMLSGPENTFDRARAETGIEFTVSADPSNPAALISIQGTELILQEGEWSDWVRVRFDMLPPLAKVAGICRFFLKKARDAFELYVSPVDIDPLDPALPLSTPSAYSRELASEQGLFYTQGMAENTNGLSAGVLDDDEYRNQATHVLRDSLRLFDYEMGRFRDGFFFFYFSTLDLNSHAFWRTMDTGHPLYSAELARKQGDFLPWLYSQMDAVIGRAMERLDGRTTLMVVSDHGFASFRRQFNLNSWLMDNGYAVPVPGASRGQTGYFADVDWPGTRAYGLGLNGLYLNLKGREPHGVVTPGDGRQSLLRELAARLKEVRDPATGDQVISNVYRPDEIYSGPYVSDAPDLLVCYNRNYRASWDTILGKYPTKHLLDNTDPWSGDHALDSGLVPGVFLANRKLTAGQPGLEDMAPTILRECGVPAPKGMTGKNVL